MFCSHCGRENKQGNKFCAGCGAPLVVENTNVVESNVVNTQESKPDEMNSTLLKVVKIMFIIGGGIAIIGFGIAIFTLFYIVSKFMV